MNQVGFRELDARLTEGPEPSPPPAAAPARAAPAPAAPPPTVFAADHAEGPDMLARGAAIGRLAELAAHARSETPLCIGLLGPAGAGKSFALRRLTTAITALTTAASAAARGPFLSQILIRPIDAGALEGDPATALAGELYAALAAAHPQIAQEAGHAVRDPRAALREAVERHDEVRRKLEAERLGLEEADSRRARLVETVLYETPGAQVESYARANRGRIEAALARFGVRSDHIRTYKDLVRATCDSGAGGRAGLTLRAFWGFKGQTRLIVMAVLLALVGIGLGVALDTQASWIGWLRGTNPSMGPTATWIEAHVGLLATLQEVAWLGAGVALVVNLWRAARFLQPVFRGVALLKGDLAQRRRDLDTALAHQTRRVDGLAGEADAAARRLAEAQRRAEALGSAATTAEPSPFGLPAGREQAQRFFAAVAALVGTPGAPQRIVIALDNLDGVPPPRGRNIMAAAHRLLRPGFLLLATADPHRLAESPDELEKWIQIPFHLEGPAAPDHHAGLVRALLGGPQPQAAIPAPDATRSVFDAPISESEAALLATHAPLVGPSPRAVKRFVNLYRLARADADGYRGATALMLALNASGRASTRTILDRLAAQPDATPVDVWSLLPEQLRAAAVEVAAVDGTPTTVGQLRAAAAVAAPYAPRA